MELPKTILVATDFSECAQEALRYATKLAKAVGARVCLVHSWQVPMVTAGAELGWVLPEDIFVQIEAAAKSALEQALARVRADFPNIEGQLAQGDARDAIVRKAAELRADLVVVGTHGRRGLPRLLLGSVAEYVVRHAPCAVLTVRRS